MKSILALLLCAVTLYSHAQNVGIGTKKPLSKLHVAGDLRIDSLAVKDSGLVLHNREGVLRSLKFTGKQSDVLRGDGTFASATLADASWLTTGNAGTDPAVNFIGTTDDKPLRFRIFGNAAGGIGLHDGNNAIGVGALLHLTTGQHNTAFGDAALINVTEGYNNTAVGSGALANNIMGRDNTAVGSSSLRLSKGFANTGVGSFSLSQLGELSSFYNTALGYSSLQSMTLGWGNVAIGANSQLNNVRGTDNVSIGVEALYSATLVSSTVAIGARALYENTTGVENHAVGAYALKNNTTGYQNTAEGFSALVNNTTGSSNTALGTYALAANTTASRNTALGYTAMYLNTVGKSNVAVGYGAMSNNTVGSSNVAVGYYGLTHNKTGNDIVAVGDSALLNNSSGNYNTAVGQRAMLRTTSGGGNTGVGHLALSFNSTGINNTAVGKGADVTGQTFSNATAIGYNAKVNASNKVRIGNASVTKIEGQVPFTTPSDGRFKFNIREDVKGLAFILKLRPVTYQFDVKKFDGVDKNVSLASYDMAQSIVRTGFIAQEVETAASSSGYNFSGISKPQKSSEYYSLSYESFVVPLVKGMQEQQQIILSQRVTIESLKEKLETQEQLINQLLERVEKIEAAKGKSEDQ